MDDKFILMGLDDERSKKVAEVLGNKTCKKIIDHLAGTKESSEKDISEALGIPLNTVEYNLNKLLKTGLVEKTKNFFWSKRGKKIPMYKLANKHIVISPKSTKPNLTSLKTIIPVIATIAIIILLIALMNSPEQPKELNKFNSLKELKNFLEKNSVSGGEYSYFEDTKGGAITSAGESSGASDYSATNIQVEGVDEADIIKNDGKYIYVVSNNKVIILDAYPAENMKILSEIEFTSYVGEIFINDDKLIVFAQDYGEIYYSEARCMAEGCVLPPIEEKSVIYIYDISDKENPELEEEISVSGNYHDSRMIENYVYVIANQYAYEEGALPIITKNSDAEVIKANEIYYSDIKDTSFQYTIMLSINLETGETSDKTILTGRTQNIYVSQDNIFTIYTKYQSWYSELTSEEKTIINKFSIDKNNIEYIAIGEVPGHILNQFSMDEYQDNFRIATTIGQVWDSEKPSQNNIYILDENLKITGKLEGLAPGESIYSVRFMGDRGYVVTFKKVDPLFVIDLSNPASPDVLGKLKIPGYSDYLHPYDENHIIGIGKEAVEAQDELRDFAWYQGIKMAIFDVSDVENPVELHKVVIGDRGTNSEALYNHKAFLFDKEKELLVLPITLAEIKGEKTQDNQYGEFTFQGAYVYNINLKDGFELKGRITHYNDEEVEKKSGYYFYGDKDVKRSLYMDNTLYTFSNEMIKANNLNNLEEINLVEL